MGTIIAFEARVWVGTKKNQKKRKFRPSVSKLFHLKELLVPSSQAAKGRHSAGLSV
jgi:hypothetical protein